MTDPHFHAKILKIQCTQFRILVSQSPQNYFNYIYSELTYQFIRYNNKSGALQKQANTPAISWIFGKFKVQLKLH